MQTSTAMKKMKKSCDEVAAILKALAHPQRLLILGFLLESEKTVGELVDLCEVSQSQMSQFLIRMKYEGLVRSARRGKFQFYSLADPRLGRLLRDIQRDYCDC